MLTSSKLQLSIILPIYNVEPYLEKCIRSLENQDIPKDSYEIICVNDGSPDNCLSIIKQMQSEFLNIVLLDQENQGVSMARNNGIKAAKGEYLMFVDPDDAIEANCLKEIVAFAKKRELDIVYSPLTFVEIDGSMQHSYFKDEVINKELEGSDLYFTVRRKQIIDPDRAYAILYKRNLIFDYDLYYLKDVPYLEDGEFIARVLCLAKRTAIYNKPYYLRLNRPGSATRSDLFNQRKTIKGFILAAKNLRNFKEDLELNERQIGLINGRIVKFVVLAVHATLKSYKNFTWVKKELKNEEFGRLDLSGIKVKTYYYELGELYNRSLDLLYISSKLKNLKKSIKIRIGKA